MQDNRYPMTTQMQISFPFFHLAFKQLTGMFDGPVVDARVPANDEFSRYFYADYYESESEFSVNNY